MWVFIYVGIMEGWVKLHRKILEWEWYSDPNTFRVFLHILLSANHKKNKWQWVMIEKWSFITSFEKLSTAVGLSVQQVRTAINKLENTWELTRKSTSKWQAITVCKWCIYQNDDEEVTSKSTSNQQTNNKQITTNKNDKNDKNEKKKKTTFSPPTLDEVKDYFTSKWYTEASGERAFEYYNVAWWIDWQWKQVRNRRQKMNSVWFKEENKKKEMTMDQRLALYNKMWHVPFRIKYWSEKATEVKLYSL